MILSVPSKSKKVWIMSYAHLNACKLLKYNDISNK